MKIETAGKTAFRPVTITIETPEEARAMWHRFNVPAAVIRQAAEDCTASSVRFDSMVDRGVVDRIWCAVNQALIEAGEKK